MKVGDRVRMASDEFPVLPVGTEGTVVAALGFLDGEEGLVTEPGKEAPSEMLYVSFPDVPKSTSVPEVADGFALFADEVELLTEVS